MQYTKDDLCCCDIRWYAVDKNGYIFSCTSAGAYNVPKFVCKNREETGLLDRFFLYSNFNALDMEHKIYMEKYMEEETIPQKIIDALILYEDLTSDDHIILALKGITSFDTLISYCDPKLNEEFKKHPYWCKKLTNPTKLLHFNQLPEDIQKIMDSRRMNDLDVTKTDYFFVSPPY